MYILLQLRQEGEGIVNKCEHDLVPLTADY
jgi:hypothetical protein